MSGRGVIAATINVSALLQGHFITGFVTELALAAIKYVFIKSVNSLTTTVRLSTGIRYIVGLLVFLFPEMQFLCKNATLLFIFIETGTHFSPMATDPQLMLIQGTRQFCNTPFIQWLSPAYHQEC